MLLAAPGFAAPRAAAADPCPDIGVAFARGTAESPGVGNVGQAFVDTLRQQVAPRTVGVHGVNYPASNDFAGPGFIPNVVNGTRDLLDHVRGVVSACPETEMVLGGYSQGAMVTAFATSDARPNGVPDPAPLPPDVADDVAAVVLFGKPNGPSLAKYGTPAVGPSPQFAGETLELCAPGDPVCAADSAAPWDPAAHTAYTRNGMVGQASSFVVSHLPMDSAVIH
ncbi:cutinase family protein [Mycolicibacterium brumae]|uniref:cutinase family protein n=1 Tax=Mycolicibacterium brumae TaxID=85968 RepID=UPI000A6538A1|nr:cutinase family protein [Mycolicibacterium brumae]RWA23296.1 hypothetical protein MBRU_00320 [Mycolicibacterium brumae DSM 44177]UWW08776.1 cutinase family protein [Mycolicibacterium brumae]